MRRVVSMAAASLALVGCVPQVVKDYHAAHPDPAAGGGSPTPRYREPPPAASGAPPPAEPDPQLPPDQPVGRADVAPSPPRFYPAQSLPAAKPVWEARPVAPDASEVAAQIYTVRPGDTLNRVAEATGAGAEAIARANALEPPFALRAGQRLTIPAGRYHTVRPGEAGIAIARAYGIAWARIVEANGLTEPFVLRVGERIIIPVPPAGTSRAAERAAAFRLDVDDILTGGEPAPATGQAPVAPATKPNRALPPSALVAAPARLSGGFAWPVDGRVLKRFGPGASGERNDGIKIAVPRGTPVRAAADGVVAYVGDGIAALGGLVIVKHGDRWTSIYGHLSRLSVQRGQAVKRGQVLALSGDSGFADRPQLHFELRKGRVPVDPLSQLPER